jgi:hypothetical protein
MVGSISVVYKVFEQAFTDDAPGAEVRHRLSFNLTGQLAQVFV